MPATLVDIAKETQTSVSTVSRVLAGGVVASRISKETRERIQLAARRLGYRPNLIARTLRTRRSNTVALLVSDIANPFFAQIGSLIEQNLHKHGYSLLLCNSGEDPQREVEHLQLLNQRAIDGLILVPVTQSKEHLMQHVDGKLPLVILDRPVPGIDCSVYSDQEQSARLLCRSMKESGIDQVALVCGPQHILTHQRRCQIVSECFDVGERFEGTAGKETGRQALSTFRANRPSAIVCTNSSLAMGVIEALALDAERSSSTDGEEAYQPVIGVFDEMPMMQLLPVPIICSAQEIGTLAEECVAQLLPQLGDRSAGPGRVATGEDRADGTTEVSPHQARAHQPTVLPARVVHNRAFRQWQKKHKSAGAAIFEVAGV